MREPIIPLSEATAFIRDGLAAGANLYGEKRVAELERERNGLYRVIGMLVEQAGGRVTLERIVSIHEIPYSFEVRTWEEPFNCGLTIEVKRR